jgi:hypothetical protein
VIDNMAYIGVGIIILLFINFYIKRENKHIQDLAPGILITTGIFFTFVGITLGLYDFDVENVDASLPSLLNGIKTAFWASATGVGSALILKWKEISKIADNENDVPQEGMSIDDIVANQSRQTDVFNEMLLTFKALHGSIAGNEDSSLVAQVKLLRIDSNEKSDSLRKEFREFATTMAENNSKAFIEALKDVIKDFNDKITEQFGDNFKQLNQAVEKTVVWQENYKNQMTESIEKMTKIGSVLEKQAADYGIVVSNSTHFEKHATALGGSLEEVKHQREQLQDVIKSLATFLETTSNNIPIVGQKVNEMTEQTAVSTQKMIQAIHDSETGLINQVTKTIEFSQTINAQLATEINRHNDEFNKHLVDGMNKATEEIKNQVITLDKELETALKSSLEGLGQQLASLSNKFVQDYTPLTAKLREVVELASKNR